MATIDSTRARARKRRGTVAVLFAVMLVVLLGMAAFAIDCGVITLARTQLQNAADAGALAGAACLSSGHTAAQSAAQTAAQANRVSSGSVVLVPSEDLELGSWDKQNATFTPLLGAAQANANSVRVTCRVNQTRGNQLRLFFAPVLGTSFANVSASAIGLSSTSCGPFIGLNGVSISGGSYTDSYNSSQGAYLAGSATQNGHVCSNNKISLSGGGTVVKGDARPGASYNVSASGGSYVTGATTPLASSLVEPPVNPGNAATVNDNLNIPISAGGQHPLDNSDNFKLSGGDSVSLPPGTYYFSSLTLSGGSTISISGQTNFYITGNVDISGGSILNTTMLPANCKLFGMGSKITLSGSSQWAGVVYAPTADITRSGGSSDYFGIMVGKTLTLSGGGGLHYDESLGGFQNSAQMVQ